MAKSKAQIDKQPNYSALVAEAEKAVGAVKDPELKQAAFVKVLDTLLAQASERSVDTQQEGAKPEKSISRPKRGKPRRPQRRRGGLVGYIEELLGEGWFKTQRTIGAIKTELANRGHHIPLTSLSGPLQRLCQQRQLILISFQDDTKCDMLEACHDRVYPIRLLRLAPVRPWPRRGRFGNCVRLSPSGCRRRWGSPWNRRRPYWESVARRWPACRSGFERVRRSVPVRIQRKRPGVGGGVP